MIRDGKTEQIASALKAGRDAGMLPLEKHLAELVHRGIITRSVAEEATVQRDSLEQFLNK
jgi:twitching motility protein PilT